MEGMTEEVMDHDDELEDVLARVRLQAEQVAVLMDMVAKAAASGQDPRLAEEKLRLFERLLWKHHSRLRDLQARRARTPAKVSTLH